MNESDLKNLEKTYLTIAELQELLPWTIHYHRDFRDSKLKHKDFQHALIHVMKATGKLAAIINQAEHQGNDFKPNDVNKYVADLVICALRMANTNPGGRMNLQLEVQHRIEDKNQMTLVKP